MIKSVNLIDKSLFAYRLLGWSLINMLIAFLLNNFLNLAFKIPFAFDFLTKNQSLSFIPLFIYLIAFGVSIIISYKNLNKPYSWDSILLHEFNLFFIRSCFWSVLLVGSIDVIIAFMRVEEVSEIIFNDDLVRALKKPSFVCTYIHIPLILIGLIVGYFTKTLGFTWLALMIVCAELIIVITRFVFSYEQSFMGDLVRYWYAALFLFASAYTLFEDGHVRVDVLYTNFSEKNKARVNLFGSLILGIPLCLTVFFLGMYCKQCVLNQPIMNFETSQSTQGMNIKYLMAGFLIIFALTMLIQFIIYSLRSLEVIRKNK